MSCPIKSSALNYEVHIIPAMFDWLWNFIYSLGFFKKDATVLLLGLDNAGKTTLMYSNPLVPFLSKTDRIERHKLKYGSIHMVVPTQLA